MGRSPISFIVTFLCGMDQVWGACPPMVIYLATLFPADAPRAIVVATPVP